MTKLQRNFTTPEQSKRLLELGVPEWTADCFCPTDLQQNPIEDATPTIITYQLDTDEIEWDKVYAFPCWSVGRLIEIMNICSIHNIVSIYRTDRDVTQIDIIIETIINRINGNSIDFSKLEE